MKKYVAVAWSLFPFEGEYEGETTVIGEDEQFKTATEVMDGYRSRYAEGRKKYESLTEFKEMYGGSPFLVGTFDSEEEAQQAILNQGING